MWFTRKFAALTQSDRHTKTRKREEKKMMTTTTIENALSTQLSSSTAEGNNVSSTVISPPSAEDIQPTKVEEEASLVIVVVGTCNVGKSTLIRLGLQNLSPKQDPNRAYREHYNTAITMDEVTYSFEVMEMDDSVLDASQDPPEFGKGLSIHGSLICYDTTNRDSLDCLPDLLNAFVSRHIPVILVGLKSDLTAMRQVDQHLGEKLGNLFGVDLFEVSAFTDAGIEKMKDIYTDLIRRVTLSQSPAKSPPQRRASESKLLWIDTASNQKHDMKRRLSAENNYHFPESSTSLSPASAGFVYAPTPTHHSPVEDPNPPLQIRSTEDITSAPQSDDEDEEVDNFAAELPDHSIYPSSFSASRRRGSKDSSDSFGSGLSVDDIIDKLLTADAFGSGKSSQQIFMKPNELVNILIERFENDTTEPQPTRQQERIRSILCLWMSQYWNDFHSVQTRNTLIVFLERISKKEELRPIRDMLSPLAVREPPLEDPDAQWGLVDSEIQEEGSLRRSAKKDSGYSESFDITTWFGEDERKIVNLRRTASTSSVFGRSRKSSISSSINHLLSSVTSNIKTDEKKPSVDSSLCRPEFAGGLINVDPPICGVSAQTTWASFGNGTLSSSGGAANFINALRDKDPMTQQCTTFMEIPDKALADQLTWIEAELFRKIKPREFVRNIWASSSLSARTMKSWTDNAPSPPHSPPTSVVMASISHFNFISGWVATMIVTQPKLNKRAAVLEKCLSIAVELRNHNNYNTLMAVLAGINSAAVLRLKQTHEVVAEKKIYKQLQSLERLMSSDRSFSSYRLALKQSEPPGIPYLGIHNQDLVSMSEANKDFKADGTIHWEKFRLMGQSIMGMMRFQYPTYTVQPDTKILGLIAEGEVLTEDERYQRSIAIEPRIKTSNSTSRLRDLWMRA
ncbi:hypothetical protein DFQ30_009167 [Apophysomyces sp. BC1015]|nr:hypothetical protein DFQ30_009167 [Apophysomyces sp. BC1015]